MGKLLEVLHWNIEQRKEIAVAFSTRRGGASALPVNGLNLGLHVGDDRQLVLDNRQMLFNALSLFLDDLVLGQQVHSAQVELVEERHAGRGAWWAEEALPRVDAMITNTPGLVLAGCYADCVPVFIIDPAHGAVALVHAGWRGTGENIAVRAWKAMGECFGSKSDAALAVIGPCVGQCCYQVDEPVVDAMQSHWWWSHVSQPEGQRWRIDLGLANQLQLEALDIETYNSSLCTSCDPRFYSHRRDGGSTGRMLGLVTIRRGAGNGHLPRE